MQYTRDKPKLHDSERLNIKMETKEKVILISQVEFRPIDNACIAKG